MGYGVECHIQQYFSFIVVVSFIGGGNRSAQRKPLTMTAPSCCKKKNNIKHTLFHKVLVYIVRQQL